MQLTNLPITIATLKIAKTKWITLATNAIKTNRG